MVKIQPYLLYWCKRPTLNKMSTNGLISSQGQPKQLLKLLPSEPVKIPVPWGFIAAKKFPRTSSLENYDPKNDPNSWDKSLPVLCFHGWLDNANTHDRLIPLIQEKHPQLEFYSFDWPGHGKSSQWEAPTALTESTTTPASTPATSTESSNS